MAVVRENTGSGATASGTTHTPSFGFTPTAGRLLVVILCAPASFTTFSNLDSSWTLLHDNTGSSRNMSAIAAFKVAAGSDTFSVDTSGSTVLQWAVAEYSGLAASSPLDQSAENESNDGSAVTSCATGTTASLGSADRFAISAWAFDTGNGWNSGRSYTNGSSEAVFRDGGANPGVCIADLQLSSSSGFSETINTTDTGDDAYGLVGVFKQAAGGSAFEVDQTSAVAITGAVTVAGDLAYVAPFALTPSPVAVAGALTLAGDLRYVAPFALAPAALPVAAAVTVTGDLAFSTAVTLQLNASPLAVNASVTVSGDFPPYPTLELVPAPLAVQAQVGVLGDLQYAVGFALTPSALPVTASAAVAGDLQYSFTPPPAPSGGWGPGAFGGGGGGKSRELLDKIVRDAEDLLERKRKPQRPEPLAPVEAKPAPAPTKPQPAAKTAPNKPAAGTPSTPVEGFASLAAHQQLEQRVARLEALLQAEADERRRRQEQEAEDAAVVQLLLG